MSDAALCAQIQDAGTDSPKGRAAYEQLYSRYRRAAHYRAYTYSRDPVHAEDIASEAFTKTLRAMARGFGPQDSFISYLLTAVRTEAQRRTRIDQASDLTSNTDLDEFTDRVSEDASERYEEHDLLRRAFQSLPGDWQQVVWFIEVEGLSRAEAATRLDTSIEAATSMLARAREALRTAYLQEYVEVSPPACQDVAQYLAGYVRGSLGKRAQRKVEAHLETCAACRAQVARLRALNGRLRSSVGAALLGAGFAGSALLGNATAAPAGAAALAAASGGSAAGGSAAGGSAVSGSAAGGVAAGGSGSATAVVASGTAPTVAHLMWAVGGVAVLLIVSLGLIFFPTGDAAPARPTQSGESAQGAGRESAETEPEDPETANPADPDPSPAAPGGDQPDVGQGEESSVSDGESSVPRDDAAVPEPGSAESPEQSRPWEDDATPNWRITEDRLSEERQKRPE